MKLLSLILAISFTFTNAQDVVKRDSLRASFNITSDLPYGMADYQASKDTTYNGIGNYRIKDSRLVYVRGCCIGNPDMEYQLDKEQLYLDFDKRYEIKVQYYFYNGIIRAYERNRYLKFRTPPYDENVKRFILQVRFNKAGGVALTVETQE